MIMRKYIILAFMILFASFIAVAQNTTNNIAGNWMLRVIEDKNYNSVDVEYGENILIFDDLLQMGCINSLRKNKRLSICDMEDYSVYAFDEQKMKLFCKGKIISDGKEITKRIVYDVIHLKEDELILEYHGQKAIYRRINYSGCNTN